MTVDVATLPGEPGTTATTVDSAGTSENAGTAGAARATMPTAVTAPSTSMPATTMPATTLPTTTLPPTTTTMPTTEPSTAAAVDSSTVSHGRGLDTGRDAPIMQAALELVGEVGYDHVTMDAIGRRARASKATIYRRWDSKAALVASALSCRHEFTAQVPDTGCLRTDLLAGISRMIADVCASDLALITGLLTAMHSDPELARLIRVQMVSKKKSALRALVARAVARGQIPSDASPTVLDEIAPAMIFTRLILTDEPVDEAFVTHLVDDILLPVLTHPVPSDVLEHP